MRTRSTLVISEGSWHCRVYRTWQRRGHIKNGPTYRENLCHYWRVVVVWAPCWWFVHGKVFGHIRPIFVAGTLGVIAFIMACVRIFGVGSVAGFVGISLAVLACVAVLCVACAWCDNHDEQVRDWFRRWVWSWFGYPCRALERACITVGQLCTHRSVHVVLAGGLVALYVWAFIIWPLQLAIITAAIVGLISGATLMWWVGECIERRHAARGDKPPRPPGMVRISAHYVVAKKHRICPFIDFDARRGVADVHE